jgi:16S rRNA (guanine527-N7)-methyltransferase
MNDNTPALQNEVSPEKWEQWRTFISDTFGTRLSDEAVEKFRIFLAELREWNEKFNLVSFRSSEEILYRHFADSLAGLEAIRRCTPGNGPLRAADIGTGAGFPGLPLKIALPDTKLTLVESITKKCSFLEHMVQRLDMKDVTVINGRAEPLGQDAAHRAGYDVVLSRAVAKFSPHLEIAVPLAKKNGCVLIYKTEQSAYGDEGLRSVERALSLLGAALSEPVSYRLPGEERTYCILIFKKTHDTPPQYPRKTGLPEKKPL